LGGPNATAGRQEACRSDGQSCRRP
jgi:hypothetical protein